MRKRQFKKLWRGISRRIISENIKVCRDTMIYGNGFLDVNKNARWRNPARCVNHIPARNVLPSDMFVG